MMSLGALLLASGVVASLNGSTTIMLIIGAAVVCICSVQWWRDVDRESCFEGCHTYVVETGLRWGIVLFILSEVLLFVSFFWAYLHSGLAPEMSIGGVWVCEGISSFDPIGVPLLNTAVLLSSGCTITWAHYGLIRGMRADVLISLGLTIVLGCYFSAIQLVEYSLAPFAMSDSVYGSAFFVMTGFHGVHVVVGSIFLSVSWLRIWAGHISVSHHFGLEASAWYWHFVDVVWLFLYLVVYCWSWV